MFDLIAAMSAATIKLFLTTGDAQSLRVAELSNWNGKAFAAPRTEFDALLKREAIEKPGVYFLLGEDEQTGNQAAYIGEAEVVRDRLKQHTSKGFWIHVIVFVSQGENLTKSHIKYLEGRIIEEASEIGRFTILNSVSSGAKLPESDCQDMEVFLDRVRQLLPVLGCDLLVPVKQPANKGAVELTCKIKGIVARGQRTAQGFVVFKGSEASATLRPSATEYGDWIVKTRNKLIEQKVLVPEADRLRFTRDWEFLSPSGAARIVVGGHANGLTCWKNSSGITLKDLEALKG